MRTDWDKQAVIWDIERLEERAKYRERSRAFYDRLRERFELWRQMDAALEKYPPVARRMAWRAVIYFRNRPYWMFERFRDALKRRKRMSVARAALKAGRLECCNDDELLELGHEWASRDVQHRDQDWEKEANSLVTELKRRAAGE